jgi:hypothetical protein
MSATPPRFSIADVWDETGAFVRREAGLLLPIAFATTGIGTLLWDLAVPDVGMGARPQAGAWMLVLLPVTLLFLIGNIAIAALVLNRGISVREALRSAVQRMGNALAVLLLFMGLALLVVVAISALAMLVGRGIGWPLVQATNFGLLLMTPVLLFVAVRLLTLWPAVADAAPAPAPVRTVKHAFANTRGRFGRLAAATLLYALAYVLILGAIQFGLGSVLLLIGRATGQAEAAGLVVAVLTALAGAAVQAVWGVYAAIAYRRLDAPSNGTD